MTPRNEEYKNQVGGRSEISKTFGSHVIKPTSIYEVQSYLKMPRSILEIAPECCFVITKGEPFPIQKCSRCMDPSALEAAKEIGNSNPDEHFLIMHDQVHGMKKPRIVDLKIGTRTHSDYISEEKKINHIKKSFCTTTYALGLRLCGATFYRTTDVEEQVRWTKVEGKSWNPSQFVMGIDEFFDVAPSQKATILAQLSKIKKVLESHDNLRFFGSSLLIVVDDENPNGSEDDVRVKLIDFSSMAHSEAGAPQYVGPDSGAIFGLTNLIQMLTQ